jgi:hypothetical protein
VAALRDPAGLIRRSRGSESRLKRLSLAGAIAVIAAPGHAQQGCAPIQFAGGTPSATVKGIARADQIPACYTLTTARGQTATLRIVQQPKNDIAFNIAGMAENRISRLRMQVSVR